MYSGGWVRSIMFIILTSSSRSSEIYVLHVRFMEMNESSAIFMLASSTKSRRQGKSPLSVILQSNEADNDLCLVECLRTYLQKSQSWIKS